MKKPLSPIEQWMVKQNLEYVKTEGVKKVIERLRAQGYHRVADGVEQQLRKKGGA